MKKGRMVCVLSVWMMAVCTFPVFGGGFQDEFQAGEENLVMEDRPLPGTEEEPVLEEEDFLFQDSGAGEQMPEDSGQEDMTASSFDPESQEEFSFQEFSPERETLFSSGNAVLGAPAPESLTTLPLAEGTQYCKTEEQWFLFEPLITGDYSFTTWYSMELAGYRKDQEVLNNIPYYTSGIINGTDSCIYRLLAGETYYFRVKSGTDQAFAFHFQRLQSPDKEAVTLKAGSACEVSISGYTDVRWFQFTPEKTGTYSLYSENASVTSWAFLHKEDSYETAEESGAFQNRKDFCLTAVLTEGHPYYFSVKAASQGTLRLHLTDCAVLEGISIEKVPDRTDYYYFLEAWNVKNLDFAGLTVRARYSDGSFQDICLKESSINIGIDRYFVDTYGNRFYVEVTAADETMLETYPSPLGAYRLTVSCRSLEETAAFDFQIVEMEKIPLLQEGVTNLKADEEGTLYRRFVPSQSAPYELYQKHGDSRSSVSVYDGKGDPVLAGYEDLYYLEKGKAYYLQISENRTGDQEESIQVVVQQAKKLDFTKSKVYLPTNQTVYCSNTPVSPFLQVYYGEWCLIQDKDFVVTSINHQVPGKATVIIRGTGIFQGEIRREVPVVLGTPVLKPSYSAVYNAIRVNWDAVPGATGYLVYRKENGSWRQIGNTSVNYFIQRSSAAFPVETGTNYIYTVKAYYKNKSGIVYSDYNKTGVVGKAKLGLPVLVSAVSADYNKITLNWKPVAGATHYCIYRKDSAGKWVRIATVSGASVSRYTHTGSRQFPIVPGTAYVYTVRSYRSTGKQYGFFDAKGISGTAYLKRPVWKKETVASNGIKLNWEKVNGASAYSVFRYENGRWVRLGNTRDLYFIDRNVQKGKTYQYAVRGYNILNGKVVYGAVSAAKNVKA